MAGTNPLEHVVQHPIVETELDVGLLTPEGVVTLFSDHIAMIILAGALLCVALPLAINRSRKSGQGVDRMVIRGFAGAIEVICQYLRKEVVEPTLGEHTDRFIKYVWSLFFFVLAMNLLGMLPIGVITPLAFGVHIGGTATGNIWVTGTLAVMTLSMMVINGLRLGKVEYLKHFCPGPWWMAPILVPVEIAGLLAKTFALAVRLFANMLAGHLILAVLLGFILSAGSVSAGMGFGVAVPSVLGSAAISLLELFVAFLQAFIFTFLTTLFIGMSVVFHHDDHEEATAH
ncbi:MAG: F0F1 ATP synthase subunit A [Thermoanaerobaculia bacterium]